MTLSLAAGCGSDRGPGAHTPVSQQGAAVPQALFAEYGEPYGDAKLAAWLNALGQSLAAHSNRPELRFTFAVLDSGSVNAFSTPSGHVYVTRGLIALAASDAEIAAVLGHEMGHVADRDQAAGASKPPARSAGFEVPTWLRLATPEPRARFSPDQEYRADDFGIGLLRAAGFDPLAMTRMLSAIQRDAELDERSGGQDPAMWDVGYENSHPLTRDRIARARMSAALAKPAAVADSGREAFLAAIDGMTFGDGPDRGYVRRGEFVHPRAGFRFSAPDGFMIRGTASAVIAWRRDGATLVLTSAAPGIAASPLDYLVDQWASDLALDQAGPITINSRPAASAQAFVQSDRGPLNAYLLVIGWSPSLVYRLALLIPPRSADRAAAVFWPAADSFEPLTPAQAALYPPLKLRVVTVTRRDTVASLASRMATTEPREERFRILNGLGAGDAVRPGQRVKIVE